MRKTYHILGPNKEVFSANLAILVQSMKSTRRGWTPVSTLFLNVRGRSLRCSSNLDLYASRAKDERRGVGRWGFLASRCQIGSISFALFDIVVNKVFIGPTGVVFD